MDKKYCQTPKKKKKSTLLSYGRNIIFIVRVIQSTTGIYQCCSRDSDLRMYISQPSGYKIYSFYLVENRLLETVRDSGARKTSN